MTLNCNSDSNPPALNFSWFKENQSSAVGSGQSFIISSFNSSHSGRYYWRLRINMDLRDQRLSLLKVFTINRHSLSFICLYCEMIFMNILFQGFRELLCTHLLGL